MRENRWRAKLTSCIADSHADVWRELRLQSQVLHRLGCCGMLHFVARLNLSDNALVDHLALDGRIVLHVS